MAVARYAPRRGVIVADLPFIELRMAWEWTCDDCGRDQFVRAPMVSVEQMKDGAIVAAVEAEEMDGVSWHLRPQHVICRFCDAGFDVGGEI